MIYWIICKTYNLAKQSNLLTIGRLSSAGGSTIIIMGRRSREAYKPAAVKVLTSAIGKKTNNEKAFIVCGYPSFLVHVFVLSKHAFYHALIEAFRKHPRRNSDVNVLIDVFFNYVNIRSLKRAMFDSYSDEANFRRSFL